MIANGATNAMPGDGSGRPRRTSRAKRIVTLMAGLVVLVLVFAVAIPRFAKYGDVWRGLRSVSGGWLAVIAIAELLNLVTYAPNWMAALPGLQYRQSMELTMAGTAVSNIAPLGAAVSMPMQYAMLREWGFERRASSRAMVLTGVWNNFANLALPVVALVLLTIRGGKNAALMGAGQVGLVLLLVGVAGCVVVLRSERGAVIVGRRWDRVAAGLRRIRRRPPVPTADAGRALSRFRLDSLELLRKRWLSLTIGTLVGALTTYVLFVSCVRAVGIHGSEITFTEAFAAWSMTRLLGSIPITPGGLGVIEVGLTGALVAFGAAKASTVAAVLLYRILTWLPPVMLGALAALTWRRHHPVGPVVRDGP